jgi:predicted permease
VRPDSSTDESAASRVYALFLRAYPRGFRDRFGTSMRDAFLHDHALARSGSVASRARFWVETSVQAVCFGLAERYSPPVRQGVPMRSFFAVDWRDAFRSLRATPVVSAVAILSLALGIGANTALFSILNGLMLKTLPVREPSQLVVIDGGSWTNPIWQQIDQRRHEVFDDAFAWSTSRFNVSPRGETDFVQGAWASGRMFDVLGVHAVIGRMFKEADDARSGGPDGPVAVISDGFWQRRFGGTAGVLGRQITVNRLAITIIGVMPPEFLGPDVGRVADVVLPINVRALMPGGTSVLDGRSMWWLEIMGRLKPWQTIAQATTALRAMQPQIKAATIPPNWNAKGVAVYLATPIDLISASTAKSDLRTSYAKPLQTIMVVVGAVLLIACANIANLLLARASARRRELSLRLALGASRARVGRQLLVESLMLGLTGAALGLIVAKWGSALLVRQLATAADSVTLDMSMDWRVLAFTASVAVATSLIFGLAPAIGVSRVSPNEALKTEGRGVIGDHRFGVRNMLVVGQVALSLTLVVGAALFLRTLTALTSAPLGFTPGPLLSASVDAPPAIKGEERLAFFERLREAAASLPGVASASVSILTPVGNMRWNTNIEPSPDMPDLPDLPERQRVPWVNMVLPGWFRTFGTPLVEGRDFDSHDRHGSPRVMIVNQSFVGRFFPNGGALGKQVKSGLEGPKIESFEIVGVVADAVYSSLRSGFQPTVYVPFAQVEDKSSSMVLTLRAAAGAPEQLTHRLSQAIVSIDPATTFTIRPFVSQLGSSIRQERLVAMLAGFFGVLALVLAAIGLYGVTSYSVNRRRGEIGIRMALGANAGGVVRLVMGRVGWLLAAGTIVGVGLSWWVSKFVATLLFGLEPRDPLTFALAAVTLAGVGVLAGWLPARRASRIDPVRALRES